MTASPSFEAFETDRLRAHFEWVLTILRAQDTTALANDVAARRAETLDRLVAALVLLAWRRRAAR